MDRKPLARVDPTLEGNFYIVDSRAANRTKSLKYPMLPHHDSESLGDAFI